MSCFQFILTSGSPEPTSRIKKKQTHAFFVHININTMEIKREDIEASKASKLDFIVIAAIIAIVFLVIMGFLFDALESFFLGILIFTYFCLRIKSDKDWEVSKLKTFFNEKVSTWMWVVAISASIVAIVAVWYFTDGKITVWFITSLLLIADVWFSSSVDGYMNDLNNTLKADYQKPKSWLFESLFSVFIIPPMGIVATTYACLSIMRYEDSNYDGSYRASVSAYRWASTGVIVGMMCLLFIVRSISFNVY